MNLTMEKPATKSGSYTIGDELTVYRMGFGAMRVTGPGIWGEPKNQPAAIKLLQHVLELGINFIDTADSYGPEVSENLIAEALYPYPKDLVIATKGGLVRPGPEQWVSRADPTHLRNACEGSLKRLRLNQIDLYQLHRIDPKVPLEDQIGVLIDLQQEGKIRFIGLSEVNVSEIKTVMKMTNIVSVQNKYNLLDRASEDVLTYCTQNNLAFIPWFPLANKQLAEDNALYKIAQKLNATPSQIALAWLLHKSPVMLPIPGTSNLEHLEENTLAATLKLDNATMQTLNNLS